MAIHAGARAKGLAYRLSQGRRELQYVAAFWRARALKTYRRVEAALRGSPAKHANLRESAPAKGKDDSPREKR